MERCVTSVRACVFALMGSAAAAFSPGSSVFAQQTPAIGTVSPRGDAVIAWSANAGVAATKACIAPLDSPFHESRLYAMMHIAIHDALNAVDRRYRPYVLDQSASPGASPDAAVAAAARDVLVSLLKQLPHELVAQSCIDAGVTSVEADYSAALAAIPDGAARAQGIDGSTTPSARTADQTEIALFWYESSPLKWSRIARAVSISKRLDMWENARLLGLLNMALADGYIAMVATKNHYNYWRPVTAIQTAATDGNPDTAEDKAWKSLRPTPPDQDYASGHAIEGGAAAEVLKQFFSNDKISFQDCGVTLPAGSTCSDRSPVVRSFTSFSQAADENAYSRVFIGFHFRKSVEEGTAYGRKIGERAVSLYLQPVR
jgi:PAP2 superfamily